jgi:hypothetical protein
MEKALQCTNPYTRETLLDMTDFDFLAIHGRPDEYL